MLSSMRLIALLSIVFAALPITTSARSAPSSDKAVLLSKIQSLTLRAGKQTSHRRVAAVPQLRCVGGNARGKYEVDTMRCSNAGSSYSAGDVEWSCTASLPPEFKLGGTEVACEGYRDSDDDWVLKGSCGVEYRLMLTELGEQKFGTGGSWQDEPVGERETTATRVFKTLFWLLFVGVALWMVYSYFTGRQQGGRPARRQPRGGGWGGGPGGGGGGFWPDNDDPPPPYSPRPPRKQYPSQQGWRPGFWTGAGTGATAGYAAGRYGPGGPSSAWSRGGGSSSSNGGEGSSRGSGSGSISSTRYTSTGFGSTSRR